MIAGKKHDSVSVKRMTGREYYRQRASKNPCTAVKSQTFSGFNGAT